MYAIGLVMPTQAMKLLDACVGEISIDRLYDNNYYVLERQILDLVVMTLVRLHPTVTDELVDGRVGGW
jgi:hypothetical protein